MKPNKSVLLLLCIGMLFCSSIQAQTVASFNEIEEYPLFTEIENNIDIASEKISDKDIMVQVSHGKLTGSKGHYKFQTDAIGSVQFTILCKKQVVSQQTLQVKAIPTPKLVFAEGTPRRPAEFAGVGIYSEYKGLFTTQLQSITLFYLHKREYTETKFEGSDMKNMARFLQSKNAQKIKISSFQYKINNGPLHTSYSPQISNSIPSTMIEAQKTIIIPSNRILIKAYPQLSVQITNEQALKQAKKLIIKSSAGSNNFGFAVNQYSVTILHDNSNVERYSVKNNNFTPQMLHSFSKLKEGDEVEFYDILVSNKHKKQVKLKNIRLEISNKY